MKTNYRMPNVCANCKKCESVWDHECTTYFCNGDGSVVPVEYASITSQKVWKANGMTEEEYYKLTVEKCQELRNIEEARLDIEYDKRSDWEDGRRVEAYGTCDDWEKA